MEALNITFWSSTFSGMAFGNVMAVGSMKPRMGSVSPLISLPRLPRIFSRELRRSPSLSAK